MPKKKLAVAQRQERDQLGRFISGCFTKKKRRSPPEEVSNEHKTCHMMRRNKAKNLHLCLYEIMRRLKHSFKKEKPQHDNRLAGKKRRFHRSLSTKDHFFLERMICISHKRSHQGQDECAVEKHLTERLNNEDSDQNIAQRRIVSLPEYLSPFSSPGRIWDQDSTVLSRTASYDFIKSKTLEDDSISIKEIEAASSSNQIVDEIPNLEACDGEIEDEILKEASHEESLPQLPLLSVASQSQSKIDEYEIISASGEAKRQSLCNRLDEKESVFMYVKAVLDAIDSNWEELYLKSEFSDQLLNPALISNIPFYPNQLCVDHELLFDCINEVLFEFCRFPQWVSFVRPRIQFFSYSVESIIHEVQKQVYCHLYPFDLSHSLEQMYEEDMANTKDWLDIRCDLECIGFETSELILNELLEELMLDL